MLPGRSIQAPSVMPGLVPGISTGCLRRMEGRISPSGGFALREPQPSPPRRRGSSFGFPGTLGRFGLLNTGCGSIADHGWTPAFAGVTKRGPGGAKEAPGAAKEAPGAAKEAPGAAKEAPGMPLAFAAAIGSGPDRRLPA